jgi:SAM-dependent methyltransferase
MRFAPPGTIRDRALQPLLPHVRKLVNALSASTGSHAPQSAAASRPDSGSALYQTRLRLSARFIRGAGIEVGALHNPLPVPNADAVVYVDRVPLEQLRNEYPELAQQELVTPSVIDDGEVLGSLADASVDFVIANHFIEHCQNPIAALRTHLRVLKYGGVLFMAVPDKRFTFDRNRPLTPLGHVVRDYEEGPAWSLRPHVEEWVELVEHGTEERVEELVQGARSIHFHAWTSATFSELLDYCREELAFPFTLEAFEPNGIEFVAILRKTQGAA